MKLAEDCQFDLSLGKKEIDTMNIIFDTVNNQVYIMAGSGSYFEMKMIPMDEDFTKIKLIDETDFFPTEQIDSQQSIQNEAFKLDIKAS